MITLAHIINPFKAPETSDLYTAQPITFESMRRAKQKVSEIAEVQLLSAHFAEDEDYIPKYFRKTPVLKRSVQDLGVFSKKMKLPLIADILDRAYHETDATYIIYTNVDILVHEDFYLRIANYINQGLDAFIINRRRIPEKFKDPSELDAIFKEKGKKHPGFDCFVFKRSLYPKFQLANICIGVPFIGITLAQNLFCFAENFRLFEDEYLTYHIGMDIFPGRAPRDYFRYNQKEFWKAMQQIKPFHHAKKLPFSKQILPIRLIKYGLQPSIPIRWVLILEYRAIRESLKFV